MPTRFESYRMTDGVTVLAQDFFNSVFADIDTRIATLEALKVAWADAVQELTTFGLQRIDNLIGPSMAEVNAMLVELRAKRDQLLATIGDIGNLVTDDQLATALADLAARISKAGIGLGNVDNVSAADLRDRATHTGQQPIDSVTGLATALAARTTTLVEAGTITANTTALAGRVYDCDTTAAAFTLTLPAAPAVGDRVGVRDIGHAFTSKPLTLNGNGARIEGAAADPLVIDTPLRGAFIYRGAALGWVLN